MKNTLASLIRLAGNIQKLPDGNNRERDIRVRQVRNLFTNLSQFLANVELAGISPLPNNHGLNTFGSAGTGRIWLYTCILKGDGGFEVTIRVTTQEAEFEIFVESNLEGASAIDGVVQPDPNPPREATYCHSEVGD